MIAWLALAALVAGCWVSEQVEFHDANRNALGSGSVLITELMYNPRLCDDPVGEWVELHNASGSPVALEGWRLEDTPNRLMSLDAVTLQPGAYWVVARSLSGCGGLNANQALSFALNNGGDTVTLRDPSGVLVDQVVYPGNAAPEGRTWQRRADAQGRPVQGTPLDWELGPQGGSPGAGYATCTSNADCGAGALCCGGGCSIPACDGDAACSVGTICSNPNTCGAVCAPASGTGIKLLTYNVEFSGVDPRWQDVMREENPDVAVLVEVGTWDDNGNALLNTYVNEFNGYFAGEAPYVGSVAQQTGVPNTGIGLLTRYPIVSTTQLDTVTLDNGSSYRPTHTLMVWGLDVGARTLYVAGVYLKCCGGPANDEKRDRAMEGLINYLDGLGPVPVVLMGDFNAVSPADTDPGNADYNPAFVPALASDLGTGPLAMLLYPQDARYGRYASQGVHAFRDSFRTLHPSCATGSCCGNGGVCSDTGTCLERGYTYIDGTFDSRIDFIVVNSKVTLLGPATVGDTSQACGGSDHLSLDVWVDVVGGSCGNGVLDRGEACEGGALNGATCVSLGFDGGSLGCTERCTFDTLGCQGCGNNRREGSEICDGTDLVGQSCASQGFGSGQLRCSPACDRLDTGACTRCGDGVCGVGETPSSCRTDCGCVEEGAACSGNRDCCTGLCEDGVCGD